MKKIIYLFLLCCLICLFILPIFPQQQEEKKDLKESISTQMPKRTFPAYQRAGRKDPFRDLLAGRDTQRETSPGGKPEIYIDDLTLIGIVKARGKLTAIVTGPQEFPMFIKVGYQLTDGYLRAIDEYKVTFRKTKERGFPLFRPKDIVKEIHPEER